MQESLQLMQSLQTTEKSLPWVAILRH